MNFEIWSKATAASPCNSLKRLDTLMSSISESLGDALGVSVVSLSVAARSRFRVDPLQMLGRLWLVVAHLMGLARIHMVMHLLTAAERNPIHGAPASLI